MDFPVYVSIVHSRRLSFRKIGLFTLSVSRLFGSLEYIIPDVIGRFQIVGVTVLMYITRFYIILAQYIFQHLNAELGITCCVVYNEHFHRLTWQLIAVMFTQLITELPLSSLYRHGSIFNRVLCLSFSLKPHNFQKCVPFPPLSTYVRELIIKLWTLLTIYFCRHNITDICNTHKYSKIMLLSHVTPYMHCTSSGSITINKLRFIYIWYPALTVRVSKRCKMHNSGAQFYTLFVFCSSILRLIVSYNSKIILISW